MRLRLRILGTRGPDPMAFTIFPSARRRLASSAKGGPKATAGSTAARGGWETAGGEGWRTSDGVKKSYGKRQVVKGVTVAVARGEVVGLLGPNGAGKTTVFYMITGLVPADAGRIIMDGRDVTRLPMYR